MEPIENQINTATDTFMEDCLKRFPNPGPFATEGEKKQADHKKEILFMTKGLMGESMGYKIAIDQLQNDFKAMLGDHREALKATKRAHKAMSEGNMVEATGQLNIVTKAFEASVNRLAPMDDHRG
jgi:hypothetical protein